MKIEELGMNDEQLFNVVANLVMALVETIDWDEVRANFLKKMGDDITDDQRQKLAEFVAISDSDVDQLCEMLNSPDTRQEIIDAIKAADTLQSTTDEDDNPEDEPEE